MANRILHYLPCTIVCHGECELIFSLQLQMKNKRDLNPLSEKRGKKSILINTVIKFLDSHFPTKQDFIRIYRDELCLQEKYKIINHKIFVVMDKDETTDKVFGQFKDKSLFKGKWYQDIIEPIYFNPDFDSVLDSIGYKINRSGNKPAQYYKIFTLNYDDAISKLKNVSQNKSNINKLLEYIEKLKK